MRNELNAKASMFKQLQVLALAASREDLSLGKSPCARKKFEQMLGINICTLELT